MWKYPRPMAKILAGYGDLDALWTGKTCGDISQCLLSNSYPLLGSLWVLFSAAGPRRLGLGWRYPAGMKARAILDRIPCSTTGPLATITSIYGTASRASTGKYCVGDALSLSNAMELLDTANWGGPGGHALEHGVGWGQGEVHRKIICVQTRYTLVRLEKEEMEGRRRRKTKLEVILIISSYFSGVGRIENDFILLLPPLAVIIANILSGQ